MKASPYTPGAGHSPPVLAGRNDLLQIWRMALNDVGAVGRIRAPDIVLTGPRGVGKTATLTEFGKLSADQGWEVVNLQAVVGNASLIDSLLRRARARIDAGSSAWKRAFGRIASVNLTIAGTGGGIATHGRDIGRDSALSAEDVADALAALASGVGDESASAGVLVTVDEMQAAAGLDLALIAAALQRLNVEHPTAAVLFAGTGLPHTLEVLARAGVTHADRLLICEPSRCCLIPTTPGTPSSSRRARGMSRGSPRQRT